MTPDSLSPLVSYFPSATQTEPTARPLAEILEGIRNGTYRTAVECVRTAFAEGGKDAAAPHKKKLPGFTAAGTFTRRAADAFAAPSGFIVADLDGLGDRLAAVRAAVDADEHTAAAFVSPSGVGLKILYRAAVERSHAETFADARAHVLAVAGEEIDKQCKDVSRLCFVSYDPTLRVNFAAAPLPISAVSEPDAEPADALDEAEAKHGTRDKPDAETVAALLACIPPRPAYEPWLRIASAVWDALGESAGCDALKAWSPEESPGEYREKYRHRLARVTSGTLFFIAESHAPERAAVIKGAVAAPRWFPAATWGEGFAEAWRVALENDKVMPRPLLAVRTLVREVASLRRFLNLSNPDAVAEVRARLVSIASLLDADRFAFEDVAKLAADLMGVKLVTFRAAVKEQAEAERVARVRRAVAKLDDETISFDGSGYWREELNRVYGKLTREDVRLHINKAGLSKHGDPSPCDAKLHDIQTRNRVDYAGPLCGRPAGLHKENGLAVLATRGPAWIDGSPGDWPTLRLVIGNLFGAAAGDVHAGTQAAVFFGWLRFARDALRHHSEHRPGQVLAFVGPPDCGKTLLQSAVVTPALGGRVADPGLAFTGQTTFNADLWGAEHLALGDRALDVDGSQRTALRNELKRVVAEANYPLHAKHRDGLTLRPIWRITLSANDDPESAGDLPTLDGAFADKIIYLRCYAPPAPFYDAETPGAREAFAAKIREELPAFLAFVDAFPVPASLRKHRFGVTEWHHPAILELLGEGDPLRPFSDLLESWIAAWPAEINEMTHPTAEFFTALDAFVPGGLTRSRLCSGHKHLGRILAGLAAKPDWRNRLSRTERRVGAARGRLSGWRIEREENFL